MSIAGFRDIYRLRLLEDKLKDFGLKMVSPKYQGDNDKIALIPIDQELPVYSRNAEIFVGSFDEIENWFCGVLWCSSYYQMLKLVTPEKIARKEQDERNRQLLKTLSDETQNKFFYFTKKKVGDMFRLLSMTPVY